MITISSGQTLRPMKIFGVIILSFCSFGALLTYWQGETVRTSSIITVLFFSYLFLAMDSRTEVHKAKIIKKRGWLFPSFKSKYTQLKSIELDAKYIYMEGTGSQSYFAFYIGVLNGPFNDVVDLCWGDNDSSDEYIEFLHNLRKLTRLPIIPTKEFKAQFSKKFGDDALNSIEFD